MPALPAALDAALATHSLDEILAATLQHFGCQAGTIHRLQDGVLHLAAHAGLPPAVTALVQTVPIGKGIAGLAAERREPITICNLQTDDSGQARPAARSTGMEGTIAVPMLDAGGELRGVFGIGKATAYTWPPEEIALLEAVARAAIESGG